MRAIMRWTAVSVAILCVGLAAGAQDLNRDPSSAYKTYYGTNPKQQDARVDINHASLDKLLTVPGLTHSWAGRVVRFRPYRTKLDLVEHGVLTSQVYDRIKDYVIAHRDK